MLRAKAAPVSLRSSVQSSIVQRDGRERVLVGLRQRNLRMGSES